MTQPTWNPALYDNQHAFVWQYGESLIDWLAPQSGERILDLGCGTGHLTAKIVSTGAIATGIDADAHMIEQAQQHYPHLQFAVMDARCFQVEQPLDAVFSNATLHWIPEAGAVLDCVQRSLQPGGRFVAEFGGKGNVGAIVQALFKTLADMGYDTADTWNPWYFPSVADYATLVEQRGLEVVSAMLFDRPTPLADGEAGLANWLRMFGHSILSRIPVAEQSQVIAQVEEQLRPIHFQDGTWIADYRRLRIMAVQ